MTMRTKLTPEQIAEDQARAKRLCDWLFAPAERFVPYYCSRCGAHVVARSACDKCPCGECGAQHVRPQ